MGSLFRRTGIFEKIFIRHLGKTPFTQVANLTGVPAMSVPLHYHKSGLPLGIHFSAAMGREDLLFRLAAQLERAHPWAQRHPEPCKTQCSKELETQDMVN
jgi:amidase